MTPRKNNEVVNSTVILSRASGHRTEVIQWKDCKIIIIGSDNGLSPDRRQAIIWTNVGISLLWNFNRNQCIFIQGNANENVVYQSGSHLVIHIVLLVAETWWRHDIKHVFHIIYPLWGYVSTICNFAVVWCYSNSHYLTQNIYNALH